MRKLIIFFTCMLLFTVSYAETKISYISGYVLVGKNSSWYEAKRGTILKENNEIKTMAKGRAMLTIDKDSHIWIRPKTKLKIGKIQRGDLFNLIKGKIKAKIKMFSRRKFIVRTPVSVASVRGTEFICSSKGKLIVLKGKVEFGDLKLSQRVQVVEGQVCSVDSKGNLSPARNLTSKEKLIIEQEWEGFEKKKTKKEQDKKKKKKKEQKTQTPEEEEIVVIPEPSEIEVEEASPSIP